MSSEPESCPKIEHRIFLFKAETLWSAWSKDLCKYFCSALHSFVAREEWKEGEVEEDAEKEREAAEWEEAAAKKTRH